MNSKSVQFVVTFYLHSIAIVKSVTPKPSEGWSPYNIALYEECKKYLADIQVREKTDTILRTIFEEVYSSQKAQEAIQQDEEARQQEAKEQGHHGPFAWMDFCSSLAEGGIVTPPSGSDLDGLQCNSDDCSGCGKAGCKNKLVAELEHDSLRNLQLLQ